MNWNGKRGLKFTVVGVVMVCQVALLTTVGLCQQDGGSKLRSAAAVPASAPPAELLYNLAEQYFDNGRLAEAVV